jgi:glycosyltransferase involved in cell wall biosynthesis
MYPKILVYGQVFNYSSGGGITQSNLFKGWPKDRIAVLATGHEMNLATTDICNTYYQLGIEEYKWKFPFTLLQKKYKSGLKKIVPLISHDLVKKSSARTFIMKRIFFPLIQWTGIIHTAVQIQLSESLKKWLSDFTPDIIYIQISAIESIKFADTLIDYLKIRSAVHIMDDWPTTLSKGLFRRYWHKKIDTNFRSLLIKIDVKISISDSMSAEYQKRYGITFIPFHNPVETGHWFRPGKNIDIDRAKVILLYSGRIGYGITKTLLIAAAAADLINKSGVNLEFHVQTPSRDEKEFFQLRRFDSVVINPFAEYETLPEIYSNADILLLPCDFNRNGIEYLKYSMPTKAPEYMISGTPVLVFAPEETAVSKFFLKHECGICVCRPDKSELAKAINKLVFDVELRKKISTNSVDYAIRNFDADKIRTDFKKLLNENVYII